MKRILSIAVCLVAMFCISAPATFASDAQAPQSNQSNNSLVGTWYQEESESGVKATSIYEFGSDGRVYQNLSLTCASPRLVIEADGYCKYTYSGNTIKFKFKNSDINIKRAEIEGVPQYMIDAQIDQVKSNMANQEQVIKDVKINGNTLTAKVNGVKVTWTRVK